MTIPIRPGDFAAFFRALHDNGSRPDFGPFPWQRRLAERVAVGTWPDVLDLPTASGKTACIDVAVFALACQATLPPDERTAHRRILFVVDRRVIVDAAHRRARAIAERLRSGLDARGDPSPTLARIADALRFVGGLGADEDPLACAQLRGGVYRDQSWARTPAQPTVISSTVDQVGSRLLFRGYGVSDSLRPIHAALAGNDALILLDEAHCARPFLQTARAVGDYRRLVAPGIPTPPPFRVAVLSATPPRDDEDRGDETEPFGLDEEDRRSEHLGRRLAAAKPAALVQPINAPFKPGAARDKFVEALAEHASDLAGSDGPRAVVVFVNRVDTAKAVHKLLDAKPDADAILMIGRMRPIDREALMNDPRIGKIVSGAERKLDRGLFVVTTQCLEVGADFDFDALVTECASLDALRQRFGRLNRLGRPIAARAAILVRADQVKEGAKPDPIYGEALVRTWLWLQNPEIKDDDGAVDFGIDALATRLPDDPGRLGELCAPAADAPVLLPSHIDCWAQTAPRPEPDPDPALFLHGPGRDRPEVQVCWRADLDAALDDEVRRRWADVVSLCPPVAAECMTVPLHLARAWLAGQDRPADDDGDVEHADTPDPGAGAPTGSEGRAALRWAGPDDERTDVVSGAVDLRPGDTLVIPADLGGWDVLGHIPGRTAPSDPDERAGWVASIDVAERAYQAAGRRAVLRLDPRLMAGWPAGPALEELTNLVGDREDPTGKKIEIRAALIALAKALEGDVTYTWLRDLAKALVEDQDATLLAYPDHPSKSPEDLGHQDEAPAERYLGGLVLQGSKPLLRVDRQGAAYDEATTEDDTASIAAGPIRIDRHSRAVAREVERYADAFGLPDPLRSALAVAALWHDLGKADRRFQILLHGGNPQEARLAPNLLAKSGNLPRSKQQRERARDRSGWPARGRHELLSVRLAEALRDRLAPGVDHDLVLHLIASHHGHARPLAPFADGLEPGIFPTDGDHHRQVAALALGPVGGGNSFEIPAADPARTGLHRLDGGPAERFWRLVRRHGWWGLAWLEALLRLADHRVSEREHAPEEFG